MTDRTLEQVVIVSDCRKLGYCMPGLKTFAKQHGLDFRELVKTGWSIDRLGDLNDYYANAAISVARERIRGK